MTKAYSIFLTVLFTVFIGGVLVISAQMCIRDRDWHCLAPFPKFVHLIKYSSGQRAGFFDRAVKIP